MDPKKLFFDKRLNDHCIYCGAIPNSREHVPSRVFLDKPYPSNLPVVKSCFNCNHKFSKDEQYVACVIECVVQGTTLPNENFRIVIAKTLRRSQGLGKLIGQGKILDRNGKQYWTVDLNRMKSILIKLAQGHLHFELASPPSEEPILCQFQPLESMTHEEQNDFFTLDTSSQGLFPEIGSRAFGNAFTGDPSAHPQWHEVQPGRYKYAVGQDGSWVKIVLREYLACLVAWD